MNRVFLVGNLSQDPKNIGKTSDAVILNVAVNNRTKDGTTTEFIDVKTFGNVAATCQRYLSKGRKVAIEGKVKVNKYEGKTSLDIIADAVDFLDTKKKEQTDTFDKKPSEMTEEELDSLFGGI